MASQPRRPLLTPDDAKGMKIRGGSREMDMMLKEAGASVLSRRRTRFMPRCRPAPWTPRMTSSTSLISFRLEEVAKFLTSGRGKSYWFMFEPLIMSKQIFDKLPKAQQDAIMAVGAELEDFGTTSDGRRRAVAAVYVKAGAKVPTSTTRRSGNGANRSRNRLERLRRPNENCAKLLKLAEAVA